MGIFDIFSGQGYEDAARARAEGLARARAAADAAIDTGSRELRSAYGRAGEIYDPLYRSTHAGFSSYGDALGLGGPEGYERARAAFRTSPGYEFALKSGLDALDRRAASRGMLASGNTNIDTLNFAKGLADQEWGNYIARLAPYLTGAQTATAGRAGIETALGSALNTNQLYKGGIGFQTEAGIGNANADGAIADSIAGANFWKALLGGANAASKLWGG
jgi:hypothetical protein